MLTSYIVDLDSTGKFVYFSPYRLEIAIQFAKRENASRVQEVYDYTKRGQVVWSPV